MHTAVAWPADADIHEHQIKRHQGPSGGHR